MFQSRKPTMLFAIALLIVSATLLSSCRVGSGISPTYTPLPPTPVATLSPLASPAAVVERFAQIYSAPHDDSMKGVYELFDRAYGSVGAAPITCALQNSRSSYGTFDPPAIDNVVISGTIALVRASLIAPTRTVTASFNLIKEAGSGWQIDSIIGWIGGDITPQNPVGASQSCLTPVSAMRLVAPSLLKQLCDQQGV